MLFYFPPSHLDLSRRNRSSEDTRMTIREQWDAEDKARKDAQAAKALARQREIKKLKHVIEEKHVDYKGQLYPAPLMSQDAILKLAGQIGLHPNRYIPHPLPLRVPYKMSDDKEYLEEPEPNYKDRTPWPCKTGPNKGKAVIKRVFEHRPDKKGPDIIERTYAYRWALYRWEDEEVRNAEIRRIGEDVERENDLRKQMTEDGLAKRLKRREEAVAAHKQKLDERAAAYLKQLDDEAVAYDKQLNEEAETRRIKLEEQTELYKRKVDEMLESEASRSLSSEHKKLLGRNYARKLKIKKANEAELLAQSQAAARKEAKAWRAERAARKARKASKGSSVEASSTALIADQSSSTGI